MILKPWLWIPSQWAHDLAPRILPLAALFSPKTINLRPLEWRGLKFLNPLGIAGGVDKTGTCLLSWQKLGAGFLEVGTITPKAQEPNPGVVIKRDVSQKILWNKMGFPNPGSLYALTQLQKIKPQLQVPLFVNIGKNRTTTNELAHSDYIYCMQHLQSVADTFVVNISSPNTQGLRDLLRPQSLESFLKPIVQERDRVPKKIPLLLKLSPDMTDKEIESCVSLSADLGMDGWIVTNTTLDRSQAPNFPIEGGISGSSLNARSRDVLKTVIALLGSTKKDRLVVSVGGILSADEIKMRLDLGADLVQVYTALVFDGPFFIRNSLQQLKKQMLS